MTDSVFSLTQDQLRGYAQDVLAYAREKGASDAAVEISEGSGSRSDASCACRLEGTASNRNLGWAGFLSLLAIATLRRPRTWRT